MLGVSRTPVREALSKLEVDGLVDLLPTGGVVVRNIEDELVEIYGLRQRVEGYAAHLAAQRITADELAALEDVCSAALAAVDRKGLKERAELNNTFHRRLTEASHSPRLIRLTDSYREYFLNARFLRLYDRAAAVKQHRQHSEILEAVRQHRGDRAERLVAEHFQSAVAVIRAASGTGGPGGPPDPPGA
jgi:DNA-binding GntR family transcriptional regulator